MVLVEYKNEIITVSYVVLIIHGLYVYFIILMIMYVYTCSRTFNYVQFLVRNMFSEYRRPRSLITKFVFVVLRLSFHLILYLQIILFYTYVISPIPLYLFMCLYVPSSLDENISAGQNPIYSG